MNKKEVSEIKKLNSPMNCCITRICSCYVDAEKNKRMELKEAFLSLPEEEAFKYFTIFKSTLSGTIGKNLINMEFPLSAEAEGGTHEFLLKLRESQLKDDVLLENFYDKVIESYEYGENYYIILTHGIYDIPSRGRDGQEIFDASEYVYEFVQCSICPVKLSKAGLCYNTESNVIENRNRDWLVDAPITGFLFPAFTDRNTDIHGLLYYSKNSEKMPEKLIDELLGCLIPMSARSQKETFQAIIEETLGDSCDFESVKSIHESINDLLEETKDEPIPLTLDKKQIKKLLEINGASQENLEEFDRQFGNGQESDKSALIASNVINKKSFEVKTSDITIKMPLDKTYLVENRIVDGRPCLVIPVSDHVDINGIAVKPISAEKKAESR